MNDSSQQGFNIVEIVAGGGLGCLTGLLVGMTTASVTATVLSSVLALGSAFLGIAGDTKILQGTFSSGRLIGFSIAMSAALLGGLWLRSHDALAPSPSELFHAIRPLTDSNRDAWETVAFVKFGLLPKDQQVATPEQRDAIKHVEATLFATTPAWCDDFARREQLSVGEQIAWLSSQGGEYRDLALRMMQLPQDRQAETVHSFRFYICRVNS